MFHVLKEGYTQASPQRMASERVDFCVDVVPSRHEGSSAERSPEISVPNLISRKEGAVKPSDRLKKLCRNGRDGYEGPPCVGPPSCEVSMNSYVRVVP